MTIMSVQQAFEDFERRHVRVPDAENRAAQTVQADFRSTVKDALDAIHRKSFLAGSYRRKTQAVHLKDLDIVFVLNDLDGQLIASASSTLALMKGAATQYGPVVRARTKCRAVECHLNGYEFWVDAVPALPDGNGGLLLPYVNAEEHADEWRPADPDGQTTACQRKNDQTDGVYVPVTRVVKFWNGSFVSAPSQKKPIPSYMAEAILYDALGRPCEWADAVLAFFERAQHHLSLPWPSVPCPGKTSDYVDEKLENDRRVGALSKVEAVLPTARAAAAESDPEAAMELWAKVFGPAFPAPSSHPSLLGQAIREGVASVVGTGVVATPVGRRTIPARSHALLPPGR
jgi:hypothetical protein